MKRKIFIIAIFVSIIGVLVARGDIKLPFNSSTAYAIGDLTVDWGIGMGDVGPIFSIVNFAPGQMQQEDVDVSNGAPSIRPIGVRGVLTSETGSISAVLDIEIMDGATTIYGPKTLDQFFSESGGPDGIPLSDVNAGDTKTYTFKVTFDPSSGNEFQNTSVVFDLIMGLSIELSSSCDEIDLLPEPIIGTSKAETLTGTPGNDLIMGLEGADKINGNGGNDCILGGDGADKINGNHGEDAIFGENEGDSIKGNEGNDFMDGGKGGDKIKGEEGQDHLLGGDDADSLEGGNDNDTLEGGAAADLLKGGDGNDNLSGGEGADSLNGNGGNDILIGDGGIDNGNGGPGTGDTCDTETEVACEL